MSDPQIVLYLARHGTTILNANGCFRGNVNPPLDDKGFKDANTLAHYFSGIELGDIYSSDRIRATQTADAIVNRRKESYQKLPDLRALDVGNFSGKPKSPENVQRIEYYLDRPDISIPGGEPLNGFRDRIRPLFSEAIEMYNNTGLPCLFVVHSSIIHEAGTMFNNDHHSARVEPGGVAAVYFKDGKFCAEPIFKPLKKQLGQSKADTVS
jgi:phosphoserine phosphatase